MSFPKRAWFACGFAILTVGAGIAAAARDTAAAHPGMLPTAGVATPEIPLPALDRMVSRLAADARTNQR